MARDLAFIFDYRLLHSFSMPRRLKSVFFDYRRKRSIYSTPFIFPGLPVGFCVASLAGRGVAGRAGSSFGLGLRCGERVRPSSIKVAFTRKAVTDFSRGYVYM